MSNPNLTEILQSALVATSYNCNHSLYRLTLYINDEPQLSRKVFM